MPEECVGADYYIPGKMSSQLRLVGFGLTFGLNAAPLLITELAYPTQVSCHGIVPNESADPWGCYQRGKLTSMYNASWYMGSIVCKNSQELPTTQSSC